MTKRRENGHGPLLMFPLFPQQPGRPAGLSYCLALQRLKLKLNPFDFVPAASTPHVFPCPSSWVFVAPENPNENPLPLAVSSCGALNSDASLLCSCRRHMKKNSKNTVQVCKRHEVLTRV